MSWPVLANERNCTACCACVATCKKKALKKILQNDGHYYIAIDPNRCVQCGACEKVCPIINGKDYGNNDFLATVPYKGWSNLASYRTNGTSGGIFGAVAYDFVKSGGIVIGAALLQNECKHIVVERIEDISRLQGSKYMYSDQSGIYDVIKEKLKEGKRVLYSGLPCNVAGVLSFFSNHPKKDNLYTIDLVCGGIPSTLLQNCFFKIYPNSQILSFREKQQYSLTYLHNEEKECAGYRNPLISGFLSGLTNRYSCYHCKFAYLHRNSDLTLGDYWQKDVENQQPASLILVHSNKGKELVASENIHIEKAEWKDFLPYNPKIAVCDIEWDKRWERKNLSYIYHKVPTYIFNVIYASMFKKYDAFAIVYLVYKKMRYFLEKRRRHLFVMDILKNIYQHRNQ